MKRRRLCAALLTLATSSSITMADFEQYHLAQAPVVSPSEDSYLTPDDTNSSALPLIGFGVGNLPHSQLPILLANALMDDGTTQDLQYRMLDTSHTNPALEVLVGRSLARMLSARNRRTNNNNNNTHRPIIIHIIIKVWHTHLGYERTLQSIQDSLSDLLLPGTSPSSNLKIHALLQYPKCYDTLFSSSYYLLSPNLPIKYANCQEEEDALQSSQSTLYTNSSSPLRDKKDAWKRSYRALEELYHRGVLEGIGVANFDHKNMQALYHLCTVGPHIYQGTLHTLLMEEELVEGLVEHNVHYQCYDAVSAIEKGKKQAPRAYATLEWIGAKLGSIPVDEERRVGVMGYSAVQIVLAWLIQRGVGVLPGTTNLTHLTENSPPMLRTIPKFHPREALDIEMALRALVSGEDLEDTKPDAKQQHRPMALMGGEGAVLEGGMWNENVVSDKGVIATFFNAWKRNIRIFRVHPTSGKQIQLSQSISPGRSARVIVDRKDVLIAYDGHGVAVKKFLVEDEEDTGRVDFAVEL